MSKPLNILVTGAAGFIGSHLVEALLRRGHRVTGMDNLSTGKLENLTSIKPMVSPEEWSRFIWVNDNICDCEMAEGYDVVYHLAALGSVPRSMSNPWGTHVANTIGFFSVLENCRRLKVPRLVFASSSSVYGRAPGSVRTELGLGIPQSPYAATKRVNEVYAEAFSESYGMSIVGLRFFNVFGPKQDHCSPYSAVIPAWLNLMRKGKQVLIYGDGSTVRDFTPVDNVIWALLAAGEPERKFGAPVYNVGTGKGTTIISLFKALAKRMDYHIQPSHVPPRMGEVRSSIADVSLATRDFSYRPFVTLDEGLDRLCGVTPKDSQA